MSNSLAKATCLKLGRLKMSDDELTIDGCTSGGTIVWQN